MKPRLSLAVLLATALTLSGCEIIGGILELGFWSGVIFVGIIVLLIFVGLRAFRR